MVRKLAHFTEFFALGVVMAYLLHLYRKYTFFDRSYATLCGIAVAVIDESIQLFVDGRGAQVQDVLLDTSGVLVGLLITITASNIIQKNTKAAVKFYQILKGGSSSELLPPCLSRMRN